MMLQSHDRVLVRQREKIRPGLLSELRYWGRNFSIDTNRTTSLYNDPLLPFEAFKLTLSAESKVRCDASTTQDVIKGAHSDVS